MFPGDSLIRRRNLYGMDLFQLLLSKTKRYMFGYYGDAYPSKDFSKKDKFMTILQFFLKLSPCLSKALLKQGESMRKFKK